MPSTSLRANRREIYTDNPEARVKNKDGTIKRFPYERFVGDTVRIGWYSSHTVREVERDRNIVVLENGSRHYAWNTELMKKVK